MVTKQAETKESILMGELKQVGYEIRRVAVSASPVQKRTVLTSCGMPSHITFNKQYLEHSHEGPAMKSEAQQEKERTLKEQNEAALIAASWHLRRGRGES